MCDRRNTSADGYGEGSDILMVVEAAAQYLCARSILKEAFTDQADLEDDDKLDELFHRPRIARYFLLLRGQRPMGAGLIRLNPMVPQSIYVPYIAIRATDRGRLSTRRMKQLFAEFTRRIGVRRLLIEAENPRCMLLDGSYRRERVQRSAMRIYLLQRVLGTSFIGDPDPAAAYTRPASDDAQKVKASLLLGFVPIEPEPASFFNPERTAITIARYRQLYLELMQLDYGTETLVPTLSQLVARYPAIRDFMTRTNAYREGRRWASLYPS
ncbi:hypothetical protein ABIF27_009642 [Bradyrhizobium elkanii]|jgi:hypothetical protein|nr:hypothetical protein BLN97_44575 [Bradyrhizobium elkanii]